MIINCRSLDAETLVEFTAQLTARDFFGWFESRGEAVELIYGYVKQFLTDHASTKWDRSRFGYWDTIDAVCKRIMFELGSRVKDNDTI